MARVKAVGRLVYLDAATIKGVVDRLGLRDLTTTCADPDDRRRRAVSLTDKGVRVMKSAISVASEITAKTLEPLTAEERRVLSRLLKKMS